MSQKPTYTELEKMVKALEIEVIERRQAEERLIKREETAQAFWNAMTEAALLTDTEGTILAINDVAAQRLGRTKDQIIGMGIFEYLPPDIADVRKAKSEEVIRSGQPVRFEDERAGRFYDSNYYPVFNTEGNITGIAVFARDITDSKRADIALRMSEEKLRGITASLPGVVYQFSILPSGEMGVHYVSARSEDLFGLAPEPKGLFERFTEGVDARDRKRFFDSIAEVTKVPKPWDFEGRFIKPSGERIWFKGIAAPVQYDTELVFNGILFDITDSKRVEQELKLTQSVIDRASFGCFWISSDSRITYVNDQACRSLGYSREELLSMSVKDLDPEFPDAVWLEFWERLLKKRVQSFETVHQRKDGTRFPVEITANYVEFGGMEYSCAYVNDLSKRKQAEKALIESEERLRQAVRVSEIGVFDHDHISNTIYWSPEQRKIHGWSLNEPVILQDFIKLVHPEDSEWIEAAVRRAHDPAGDGLWDVEHRIIRRDGSMRWLTARSQTFFDGKDDERRPVRTVGAVRDITDEIQAQTEHEKLQSQLNQAQKMESVGRLAGGVAHDFNNMLGVILGHAELALDQLDPSSPLRTHLRQIEKSAHRSADLTNQLLAFARKQTIAPKVIDLNDTTEGVLKMLRRIIGEDIDMAWVPGRGLWPIKIDPGQVTQILANLLVNARDAIIDEGKVTIETENVEIDETYCRDHHGFVPGKYVMLAVSDNGCGMDRETLSSVFEPFFTTKEQGTGLGLATVFGIVKQNDGFINVYSEPGKGATFKVFLPRHAAGTVPDSIEGPVKAAKGGTETIMLVEDDLMLLQLNKTMLETNGYTVLAASAPSEALRMAEEHPGKIHLLITDVVMPEMNGRELTRRMITLLPDLKCLFMSGYTANVIAHRGVLEKGVHFLQKPVSRNDLAVKVRDVLDSQ